MPVSSSPSPPLPDDPLPDGLPNPDPGPLDCGSSESPEPESEPLDCGPPEPADVPEPQHAAELAQSGGMPMMTPPSLSMLGLSEPKRTIDPDSTPLTGREREVIQLVSTGATNQEIAGALVISESTVKSHVKHILRKLGAANRAEAVSRHLSMIED